MSSVLLELEADPGLPVDLEPLSAAAAQAADLDALRGLRLWQGRRRVPLGDLFRVRAGRGPEGLELRKAKPFLQRVGAGWEAGRLAVRGDVGDECGRAMKGGEILLHGNAGYGAGLELRGGLLRIQGDCGDALGGAATGALTGMIGGTILVRGGAGARAGECMRRGLIVIQGDCGDCCAAGMRAGTLIVLGNTGILPGTRMRRGTLVLACPPKTLPPGFASCGTLEFGFLRLLRRHLQDLQRGLGKLLPESPLARRYAGDETVAGKGEILLVGPPALKS